MRVGRLIRDHPDRAAAAVLALILALAAAFRFVGVDWDAGQHLHPDERFLTMVTSALGTPDGIRGYFDTQSSPLNPRNMGYELFVYGTLPINVVLFVARALDRTDYGRVYLVGRELMAVFDLLSIVLLYLLARALYGRKVALVAAFLAASAAFLIQQSHFFTVDSAANFFVMLFLFAAVGMMRRGRSLDIALAGVALGLALASKISIWPLVPLAVLGLMVAESRRGTLRTASGWGHLGVETFLLGLSAFVALRIAQPDMWVGPGWGAVVADPSLYLERISKAPDWWSILQRLVPASWQPLLLPDPRWAENLERVRGMITGHGMDWPPNHQWWGRTAYVFPWRNIVLYGLGLPLGLWVTGAFVAAGVALWRGRLRHFLPWTWVAVLFAYEGGQWVKTMRYFLPIYPAMILLGAWALVAAFGAVGWLGGQPVTGTVDGMVADRRRRWLRPLVAVAGVAVLGGTLVWGVMVTSLYMREHSRVAASRWIYHNIPTATALTVTSGNLPGPLLPVRPSNSLDILDYHWRLDEDRRLNPAQVYVPGDQAVVVDGLQLANLVDPAADAAPETIHAWITSQPFPAPDGSLSGVLAEGQVSVALSSKESLVRVPLPSITLEPGGEYYLWIGVAGAPIAGRLPILAAETTWDDHLPVGLDQLTPFDNPSTPGAEGLFGESNLELYDEDDTGKADRMLDALGRADYIVISSNRVYGSVAQLPTRFPMTLLYYRMLFGGTLGFDHVADVHRYPELGPFEVNDQPAEEAWHVYDHPKVDVFAKTDKFDAVALRSVLVPKVAERHWQWPQAGQSRLGAVVARLGRLLPEHAQQPPPADGILLDAARWAQQQASGTWRAVFDPGALINRSPAIAVVVWYLVVLALGVLAFPLVAAALPGLADRGWSVARTAGILLVSWLPWLAASTGLVPHTPLLVLAAAAVLALVAVALLGARHDDVGTWLRSNARLLLAEEAVFLALFAFFLLIRIGNPDLWHPYYGGEKPMDFAYLNAVLRTRSFPPYDPWFAGGRMNYYYFGFVMVGAVIELTRIVPWVAYNLAVPTLAALTGTGVFGVVLSILGRLEGRRRLRTALVAGALGAVFAVVSGNLFQVPFVLGKIADFGLVPTQSAIPGVQRLLELAVGLSRLIHEHGALGVPTGHWYWNASRAIPDVPGDTQPITEFPFFTFLYADLHAHMMALPLTVLALAVSVSWALAPRPQAPEGRLGNLGRQALRLAVGALVIGALWPTNTWDFPTYGLVAAGAIALGLYVHRRRLDLRWVGQVLAVGLPLLALSILFYWPYHATYVQPYGQFERWDSIRTPASAYLIIHGLFLFPLATWAALGLWRDLRRPSLRAVTVRNMLLAGGVSAAVLGYLWLTALQRLSAGKATPSIVTPAIGLLLLTLGGASLARRRALTSQRLTGWLLLLGAALTMLVEHFVLAGDIGRMNTVFKFYIQVWMLWAVGAAVAIGWLVPHLSRQSWGRWWRTGMTVLVACGLVYTVTAAPAKVKDRFPPMGPMTPQEREAYDKMVGPGLSGMAFTDYAVYDDNGTYLRLAADVEAMRWLTANVDGTPVVLEGFREAGYRWGSRYSIYTGSPTVIGWDWHEKQQRNAAGPSVVEQRVADVAQIYTSTDEPFALELMRGYQVRYVVVGQMEREIYSADGLAKFDRMVEDGLAERAFVGSGPPEQAAVVYRLLYQDGGP